MPADGRELLSANLALIERVIAFVCRRSRLTQDDAEEFAAEVRLKLLEDDCELLSRFEGRSKFSTFLTIVVRRMLLDFRIRSWGKWHDSAEAERLGEAAVALERLVHRDRRTLDDAITILLPRFPAETRSSFEGFAARLPQRAPRPLAVAVEHADAVADPGNVENRAMNGDRQRTAARISNALRERVALLPDEDRLILRLRFVSGMSVAQIARSLHLDQRLLYRRMEQLLRDLRRSLEAGGFKPADVLEVVGSDATIGSIDFETSRWRPSSRDERVAAGPSEESV